MREGRGPRSVCHALQCVKERFIGDGTAESAKAVHQMLKTTLFKKSLNCEAWYI